jgi:hypothetical protein
MHRQTEIAALVDEKIDEFMSQCTKWYTPKRCQRVVKNTRMTVIDHINFSIPAKKPSGLASGQRIGSHIKVSFYNRFPAESPDQCPAEYYTREDLYERSRGRQYWLDHEFPYFCQNPDDLLPAMVHELCHAFGSLVGHVAGKEDCEPIKDDDFD